MPTLVGVGAFLLGVGVGVAEGSDPVERWLGDRFGGWRRARSVNDRGLSLDPTGTYEETFDVEWVVEGPVRLSAQDTRIAISSR